MSTIFYDIFLFVFHIFSFSLTENYTFNLFLFSIKTNIFICRNKNYTALKQDPIFNLLLSLIRSSYKVSPLGDTPPSLVPRSPPFYMKKK